MSYTIDGKSLDQILNEPEDATNGSKKQLAVMLLLEERLATIENNTKTLKNWMVYFGILSVLGGLITLISLLF